MKFTAVTGVLLLLSSVAVASPTEPDTSVQDAAFKVAEPVKHLAERYPVLEKRKKGSSKGGSSKGGNHTE
ncbi:uncharacterized protein GIQ15_06220 [Arthroderma uncinatum]|uniref:uncharacterized protein n=1 Tax=Arthroderma uncinatum TaxID=74035 RepID=UPI00144A8F00|nr:uncharacterized protein GIQ15_06220 [Arthroderma uncinatum]KAF3480873.1 hypothetical protein GIQ15_06220 [Arthroderma uncinatum]